MTIQRYDASLLKMPENGNRHTALVFFVAAANKK